MLSLACTPAPPYYAVISTSLCAAGDDRKSAAMAESMRELAALQEGFGGWDSVHDKLGMTVSYWRDLTVVKQWKMNLRHREAQRLGREKRYAAYCIRSTKVERECGIETTMTAGK